MVKDIQKTIRGDLFTFMATGTGTATGATMQASLANGWGKLAVLFEDDAVEAVFFLNPMEIADYRGYGYQGTCTAYINEFDGTIRFVFQ